MQEYFDKKKKYQITATFPNGLILFENKVLTNVHKNENGVWEGTAEDGEIVRFNPRLTIDYLELIPPSTGS
jgi:intein/homing endonuclease